MQHEQQQHANTPKLQLTNALVRDLLAPEKSPLDLCDIHACSLAGLTQIFGSAGFLAAVEQLERISAAREHAIAPHARFAAAARLAELTDEASIALSVSLLQASEGPVDISHRY